MTNENLEKKVRDAYEGLAPDIKESILSDLENEKGIYSMNNNLENNVTVVSKKKNSRGLKQFVSIAACLVIVAGGLFGFNSYKSANEVMSSIMLDVNPSIEIDINKDEKVLEVQALNDDAKVIVGDMDFKGASLEVAVNAIIGSMLRNGYISEVSNSILVSVDSKNEENGLALEKRLMEEIDSILTSSNVSGAILAQVVKDEGDLESLAKQYGITTGKAKLIKEIISQNELYSFEDLVPLTINEINVISESKGQTYSNISSVGSSSTSSYIGDEKAKAIALKDAGFKESQVSYLSYEMDWENGKMVYEIDFKVSGIEYEYEINAVNGNIEKSDRERDDDMYDDDKYDLDDDDDDYYEKTEKSGKTDASTSGKTTTSGTSATSGKSDSSSTSGSYIGEKKAKSIAINHAGVSADSVKELEIELDKENGQMVYEVSFKSNGYEYDYEINASNGKIVDYESEWDD